MNKRILITGANGGIGKETARQLALLKRTEKIYLACRNESKAKVAQKELEQATGRSIFEIIVMDVSNVDSVRKAVDALNEPVDALIMNAGGMGGKVPEKLTADGVTSIFAANVLGHVVLVDELIKADKLKSVAMYASSEAVRGVKKMGMKAPQLKTSSVDEFASVFDGTFFGNKMDGMEAYTYVKYAATLWMSSEARKHPNIRFVSVSPGGTRGTAVMNDLPPFKRFLFKYVGMPILMPLMGMSHKVNKAAKRYIDSINDPAFKTGGFYGSAEKLLTGPLVDQSTLLPALTNVTFQDNADAAIRKFIR